MTLSVRNSFLALAFVVLVVLATAYGLLSTVLVTQEGWNAPIGSSSLVWLMLQSAAALAVGIVGFLLTRRAYRKSAAPELFFFALFFVTLSAEALLLVQAWLQFGGQPAWFSALLTRTMWAFRLTGLFLLFCGSLFAFGFPYRKYVNLVGMAAAAGIFLATILPLQTTSARNRILFAIGDAPGMALVTAVLAVVTAANYLLGASRPGAPDRAWQRGASALFLLLAWTLSIVVTPWGALAAVPGIVLGVWKAEQTNLVR